ncbi:unnamed protein product [Clonostachys byssicola]|uniref:Nuclease S1 n=1 Tax=Clonostachys byssicola TaxID=160290 RepID=A0A9N9Y9N3_9HYPO|nr:unnamed protein product [Clonostachys byssicola]
MMFSPIYILFSLLHLPIITAWGPLGHDTTAWVASHFVSEATAEYLKDLLDNHGEDYLARIASWADIPGNSRRTDHFIDAHDDLANRNCNVNYARDCKQEGCVISALAEYTEQALAPATGNGDINQAVRLLVHFIGDLHQPLHNEDVAQGGTQLHVRWESSDRTLHKVWDTQIAEKLTEELGGRPTDRASRWADQLASKITDGEFADQKREWLKHLDVRNPNGTAMIWSQESNQLFSRVVSVPTKSEEKSLAEITMSKLGQLSRDKLLGPVIVWQLGLTQWPSRFMVVDKENFD